MAVSSLASHPLCAVYFCYSIHLVGVVVVIFVHSNIRRYLVIVLLFLFGPFAYEVFYYFVEICLNYARFCSKSNFDPFELQFNLIKMLSVFRIHDLPTFHSNN